ncbi:MAG: STAS domain-containing protein [Nocardioides sp.]|uniref:STAS domain-containing protein n=1 Tax=Nocardioides sp. TaxID=35761 RepID=UPI0039E49F46
MELTISRTPGTGSLKLEGSIDLVSRQEFIDAGLAVLEEEDALTLDMAGVDFMDSMGIGALIELAKHADKAGKTFAIAEKSPRVSRVLEATGLADAWRPVV